MPLELIMQYWEVGVGFLALFLLTYWYFDERDQSETFGDAIERVGERAQTATGGVVGAAGSIAVALIAVLWTIGDEFVMSGMQIAGMVGSDPVLAGGVLSSILGTLGLSGALSIKAWQFGVVALGVVGVGVIWRARSNAAT